ncbi:hypothetical protein ACFQQB_63870 [Nonomuraea rubra]|uniref:hypothetical protein n=1 Tax=Nonomuraea rubra TaxID=46180 RepID=UPI00361E01C1
MENLEALVIARRLRVPIGDAPAGGHPGWGEAAARQLDAALLSVGFKCSAALLERLGALRGETVLDLGVRVLAAVRELVGDHVRHNAYFIGFPSNVPDTMEFWAGLLREALLDPVAAARVRPATLNLLALPGYGRYQHTYADLLAAHAELIPLAGDRVTVLDLGASLESEARELFWSMAGSQVPLPAEDLTALRALAAFCPDEPEHIPVRENRAVVNEERLAAGRPLLVDTVTDVLRLACGASGGDVTLATLTRFRSFRRAERRALLQALDAVASPARLGDVPRHREQWKRLGERLHPHEHPRFPRAAQVFEVARGAAGRAASAAGWSRPWHRAAPGRRSVCSPRRPVRCCAGWTTCCAPPTTPRPCSTPPGRPPPARPEESCCRCASTCTTGSGPSPAGSSPTGTAGRGPRPTPAPRSRRASCRGRWPCWTRRSSAACPIPAT